jgi:hypothetical protein
MTVKVKALVAFSALVAFLAPLGGGLVGHFDGH